MPTPAKRKAPRTAFKPGQVANPNGRPAAGMAFADRVRALVQMDELIQLQLSIARGEPVHRGVDPASGRAILVSPHRSETGKRLEAAAPDVAKETLPVPQITEVVWPTTTERLRAIENLKGSGWPQPKLVDLDVGNKDAGPRPNLKNLTEEQLDQYIKLQEALFGPPRQGGVIDTVATEHEPVPDVPEDETGNNE